MNIIFSEQKQEGSDLMKYDYYDDNTVKIYRYCGCTNPWEFKRQSTWSLVDGIKVIV